MDSYRSLVAWQLAHEVAVRALTCLDRSYHPRSRALFDQIRRAVVSVEANIVEGYALGTHGYFLRHLRIAMGSAAEAECLLRLAAELGYLPATDATDLEVVLGRCQRTLRGLLRRAATGVGAPTHHAPRTTQL